MHVICAYHGIFYTEMAADISIPVRKAHAIELGYIAVYGPTNG